MYFFVVNKMDFHSSSKRKKNSYFFASDFRYLKFYETKFVNVSKLDSLQGYAMKKVKKQTGSDIFCIRYSFVQNYL